MDNCYDPLYRKIRTGYLCLNVLVRINTYLTINGCEIK